jgi:acyl-[acyl-carrier-protein]-phospholipid O-acyltransferase/long-chain-fatty-acid--[acyl-carrier-protein] ligase
MANQTQAYKPSLPTPRQDGPRGLLSWSFTGLLATQFLGATNDNIFRWLVIGIGKQYVEGSAATILMAGTACFVFPYLILAAPAGYLADRYSKRTVIIWCKLAEIVIMALGITAIVAGSLWGLFVVLALMGGQSALFSPSKSGSIPEMLPVEKISAANGLFGLTTVVATVIGAAIGNLLSDWTSPKGQTDWWRSALVLLGVAGVGWISSLVITRLPVANPNRTFPWDAAGQIYRDLKRLASSIPMLRVALGITFFWSLGTLANLNIDQFAFAGGAKLQAHVVPLLLSLVIGVGVGSVLAGVLSQGRIELGLLPLGAGGIVISSLALWTIEGALITSQLENSQFEMTGSFAGACLLLLVLGCSAGLFHVPLEAYMQHRSERASRGSILAASNFLTFSGILLASISYWGLRHPWFGEPLCSPRQIFLLSGMLALPVCVYIVFLIPQAFVRFVVWLAAHTIYRIRVYGHQYLPETGGALLVANHVSWIDGVLLLLVSSRPIRMLVDAAPFRRRLWQWIAEKWGVIFISSGPKSIARALDQARQALGEGHLVCVFPEGAITRSGHVQAFRPGIMRILQGTTMPVVPVYLDELWGSIFSFHGGKFFWKMPRQWRYPVSIHFGQPIEAARDVHDVRQAVLNLGAQAVRERNKRNPSLPQEMIRRCKKRKFTSKVADSSGTNLTGGQLLMRTLILRRLLSRHVLGSDEQYVGVFLPPTVAGVLANTALALDQRIAVNLNYTLSPQTINQCIAQAGIKHVLTSRKFLEHLRKLKDNQDYSLDAESVYLEDFRSKVTWADKLISAAAAYLTPASLLARALDLGHLQSDDVITVIFTSGSEGDPKGVMLTYGNIASNVEAVDQVFHLRDDDVVLGVLPFFHSFGYTVTIWTVLTLNVKAVYHTNPLEAKQIGKLVQKHHGTILLATPTFLRTYLRRCTPEEFATLEVVVAGAEKLPIALADQFDKKFGVRPVEGYGTTELSPIVSVNIPPSRSMSNSQPDRKEGSVGRPVPGVSAKIVDRKTGHKLDANQSGMLLVTGPNVMKGYLNSPEKTAEVIRDGWYVTGDIAQIDEEGFIHITDRESRFSKIGGEMVPHMQIENKLNELLGMNEEDGLLAAVTAVPDERKGERLVVIHKAIEKSPEQLCHGLTQSGLPNLWIPSADSFFQVDELPVLGNGKVDLVRIKKIAVEQFDSGQ